ncbi:MAG: response regulator [Candidatus Muirbacterium halophilum]|nr:response regulator [Candidatus Muirbacterium halophilum]
MYKILVADDEKNILRIIQFNLEKNGFSVITAEDGKQAYEKIISERPDVAVLDIMMPKLNGFEITEKIREELGNSIKIILLSAKGQKIDKERGISLGADIYLTKPFSPKILISTISELIEKK